MYALQLPSAPLQYLLCSEGALEKALPSLSRCSFELVAQELPSRNMSLGLKVNMCKCILCVCECYVVCLCGWSYVLPSAAVHGSCNSIEKNQTMAVLQPAQYIQKPETQCLSPDA